MKAEEIGILEEWEPFLPPPVYVPPEGDTSALGEELHEALVILTHIVQVLDIPDLSFSSYSTAINELTEERLSLSRTLTRLKSVEDELNDHLDGLKHELGLIKHWSQVLTPGTPESSLESISTLERRRDAFLKRAKDHKIKLGPLNQGASTEHSVSLTQLIEQKEKNMALEKELKEKRARIKAFQGLPPNLDLARHELRLAREKQIRLRERLLRNMAEAVE